jgi:ABC-2 type transport system ATP-binding protein
LVVTSKTKKRSLETILSIRNLHKRFGRVHAVNNVSLEIEKGNVYGILGPNGSGKSTTLGIALNVVNKTSGEYFWFNGAMETHDALKKVGAIIERPNFYPYMTAQQNLELVCKIKGAPHSKVEEKLTLVGLIDRKDSKFRTFSLGMKQRLAIASALLNDPEILILDEPTNGLDPQGIHQIRELIKTIAARGTTILLASHLLDEVEKVCSHVLVLRKGIILYSGRVDSMIEGRSFYELAAENMQALHEALKRYPETDSTSEVEGRIVLHTTKTIAPSEINRFLVSNDIYLTHLVCRQNTLEEQFLELTK